jgi:branched-subunit amino acid aminotransferase/4-amino-4-deoxychorismate lyase
LSNKELVYLNGSLLPSKKASIAIYDAAVVLGATITDMERTFNHKIFQSDQHIERFYRSCKFARIEPAESKTQTKNIIEELVKHNSQFLRPDQELGCIQFISPGEFKAYAGAAGQNREMKPTFCIHTFPLPFSFWHHFYTEGAHVVTPSIRHVPPECIDPKIKCRSRMHWWLADQETHLVDPKAISLCLDLQGNIAETSGSNFLMYQDGAIWSSSSRNILPGVSSQFLKQLANELGLTFLEKDFQVYDVINAEEAFLASTPYCVAPVTKINGLPINTGEIGPVFKKLIQLWGEKVGVNIEEQILHSKL